jgi:hypothetical protein
MSTEITPASKQPDRRISPAPVHPLSALVTIVLDGVFGMVELVPGAVLITSLGVGSLGFVSTMLIQRYLAKDEWGPAVAKGFMLGIFAGVPFPIMGTAVGVVLLGWAGAERWIKLPPLKSHPTPSIQDGGQDVVDVAEKQ